MEKTAPQQTKEKFLEIFFTGRAVEYSEAADSVPKGYRMATLNEVALAWRENPEFREKLCGLPGSVWVDQIGLKSSGPHKVGNKGNFVRVSEEEFRRSEVRYRSRHYPRDGPVAFYSFGNWLNVNATLNLPGYCSLPVAYVKIGENEKQEKMLRK